MPSQAQIDAARRHGMTAKGVLLTNEDPESFHQPAYDVERDLVDEMVIAKWRERRDWSNEAESKAIQLFTRYETSHRRSYYIALTTLLHLRAALKPNPRPIEPPAETDQEPENQRVRKYQTNPTDPEPRTSNHEQATTTE
jgi:hypothetical protein